MASLVVITGASRGFGRALAVAFASAVPPPLSLVLLSRSADGLRETATAAEAASAAAFGPAPAVTTAGSGGETAGAGAGSGAGAGTGGVAVKVCPIDLGNLAGLEASLGSVMDEIKAEHESGPGFTNSVFVNNAASIGHLGPVGTLDAVPGVRSCVDLNMTSFVWLTNEFVRLAHHLHDTADEPATGGKEAASAAEAGDITETPHGLPSTLVNVTSLAGIKPFATWGLYCAGKAAREMLMQCVAAEEAARATALNYSPGAMDTDMQSQLRASTTVDPVVKKFMTELHEKGELIDTAASARKCVGVVLDGRYRAAAHVDYYDATAYERDSGAEVPTRAVSGVGNK